MDKTSASDMFKQPCDKETYKDRIYALDYILRSLLKNEPERNFHNDSLVVGLIAAAIFTKARTNGHTADCAEKMAMKVTVMSPAALGLMPIPEPGKCCTPGDPE